MKVTGIKEEVNRIKKIILSEMRKGVKKAYETTMNACPVDTGRLKGSIEMEESLKGDLYEVSIETDVEYAGYVEFGTSKMHPQPYLRPGLRVLEETIKRIQKDNGKAV